MAVVVKPENFSNLLEWDVREIDVKYTLIDQVIEYLFARCTMYKWVIFLHDQPGDCEIIYNSANRPKSYYHVIVWFRTTNKTGRKQYFSNIPLMQWLRRLYREMGFSVYPIVTEMLDPQIRVSHLISKKHKYIANASNPDYVVKGLLNE